MAGVVWDTSLRNRLVPSVSASTPRDLRHCQTVDGPTPNQCWIARDDSRRKALNRPPYRTMVLAPKLVDRPGNRRIGHAHDFDIAANFAHDEVAVAKAQCCIGSEQEVVVSVSY